MSIPAESKQIGKTKLRKTGNQKYQYMHTTTHFVRDEDLDTYLLEVMDVSTSLFDVPANSQCQSQSVIGHGSMGWIVTTDFGSGTYMYNLGNVVPEDLQRISYSTGEFFCHARYWGLRIADAADETAKVYSRQSGGECHKGDWLMREATNGDYGHTNMLECPIGSDYNAPFPDADSDTHFEWSSIVGGGLLNQKLATKILTVSYVSSKSPHQYATFTGINPAGFSGTPFAFQPTQKAAGIWKAVKQSVEQINIKGNVRYKITRIMESAPIANGMQTAWLLNKNGGYWTW